MDHSMIMRNPIWKSPHSYPVLSWISTQFEHLTVFTITVSQQLTEIKVLSEGFFSALKKLFKGKDVLKKNKKVRSSLGKLNSALSELEYHASKEFKKPIKLQKITFKDLYK